MHFLVHRRFSPTHPHNTSSSSAIHTWVIKSEHLFALLLLLATLRLGGASEGLGAVLALLALLSGGLLDLGGVADAHESVVGLELLHGLDRVVDEGEARRLAATVLGAHAEDVDLVLVRLVHFGELATQVIFADVGAVGVEDITAGSMLANDYNIDGGQAELRSRGCVRGLDVAGGAGAEEKDLHNHLLAGEQAVGDELPSSDGDLSVGHDCSRWESWTAKDVGVDHGEVVERSRESSLSNLGAAIGLACEILAEMLVQEW